MRTDKRVRIVTAKPGAFDGADRYPEGVPVTLVDGVPLRSVSRIEIDAAPGDGTPVVKLTLAGVDVEMDLDADPSYYVRVIGPEPR